MDLVIMQQQHVQQISGEWGATETLQMHVKEHLEGHRLVLSAGQGFPPRVRLRLKNGWGFCPCITQDKFHFQSAYETADTFTTIQPILRAYFIPTKT